MLLKNSFVNQQINVLCFTNDNVKLFANNNQTSVNTFFGVEIVTSTKPKKICLMVFSKISLIVTMVVVGELSVGTVLSLFLIQHCSHSHAEFTKQRLRLTTTLLWR